MLNKKSAKTDNLTKRKQFTLFQIYKCKSVLWQKKSPHQLQFPVLFIYFDIFFINYLIMNFGFEHEDNNH